jgi:hypothetical protein
MPPPTITIALDSLESVILDFEQCNWFNFPGSFGVLFLDLDIYGRGNPADGLVDCKVGRYNR